MLCRPLLGDGDGINPATDAEIAAETGIAEDGGQGDGAPRPLVRAAGDAPADQRAEIALLALRSGLVKADEAERPAVAPAARAAAGLEPGDQLVQPQFLEPRPDRLELAGAELDSAAALLAQLQRLAEPGLAGVEAADDLLDGGRRRSRR